MKALQCRGLSQREACAIAQARRRSSREQPSGKAQEDARWAIRLTQLAQAHPDHGVRELYGDYERESAQGDEYMNYKRFRRLYRLANLQIGRRRRRGRAKIVRGKPLRRAAKPFEGWTLDFMHDRLFTGRAFRTLAIEDEFTRTALALQMSFTFPSRSVVAALEELAREYGYPKYLRIDNELSTKVKPSMCIAMPAGCKAAYPCPWSNHLEDAIAPTMMTQDLGSESSPSLKRSLLPIGRSEHYLRGRSRLNGPAKGFSRRAPPLQGSGGTLFQI